MIEDRKQIRIGCAAGFWGDSSIALPQLLSDTGLDYIVFDYLAEVTMSILARAREKDPSLGYATDFVQLLGAHLPRIAANGVKIIANAGGVNPRACRAALEKKIAAAGAKLTVAVVTGDDILEIAPALSNSREMFSGTPFPEKLVSLNAYLGAGPIAAALAEGADIVITGRCVDSAIVLGACVHEFGWSHDELDCLSGASLAGHIVECGAQATGGLFTDWERIADWANIGYPIVEIDDDGTFTVTKVAGTGGLVSRGTVCEQLVYEIGDPKAYLLPDVTCDWSEVVIEELGADRVRVANAKGRAPPTHYKASATYQDGFRVGVLWTLIGESARRKAERVADAVLKRVEGLLADEAKPPFTEVNVEVLGSESCYGDRSQALAAREVILKLAAKHPDPKALELLVRELTSAGTSMAPGFTGVGGNRPKVMPVVRLFSLLVPKSAVACVVEIAGKRLSFEQPRTSTGHSDQRVDPPARSATPPLRARGGRIPLIELAWARSGDKGNNANIGIIARSAEFLPYIRAAVTPEVVSDVFRHYAPRRVDRYDLPGIHAINYLLHDVLGGGGTASLRNDPQAKGFAQILLSLEIPFPEQLRHSFDRPRLS